MPTRRLPPLALATLLAICLSACQVSVGIGVDVRSDGSGAATVTVQLDQQAAASLPALAQELRTSDLAAAGWQVTGPDPGPNGTVIVTASKPFSSPGAAKTVMAELSGRSGPFRDLKIIRRRSVLGTTTTFRGSVDLRCGLACFADPQLRRDLGGAPDLGLDPTRLGADAGIDLSRLFRFEVAVRLPRAVRSSNAPVQLGRSARWQARLGDRATLVATTRAPNVVPIVLAAVIATLLLAVAVVAGAHLTRRRRRRRGRAGPDVTAAL